MIQFRDDDPFEFCVSSGALAFDGGGWWWERPLRWMGVFNPRAFVVVAKTVTNEPRIGNLRMWRPWTCVRPLGREATTNAVGLTNPGIDVWVKEHLPWALKKGYRIAPSIKPENPDEARRMAAILSRWKFPFVEINLSCPNVDHIPDDIPEILRRVRMGKNRMILKLSLDQVDEKFIRAVDGLVDGYHAINTIPWDVIYPDKVSPIQKFKHGLKGGVSGPPIHKRAVDAVAKVKSITGKPVIGGGGIFAMHDLLEFYWVGADAYSFGTCFLYHPSRPNKIVKDFKDYKSGTDWAMKRWKYTAATRAPGACLPDADGITRHPPLFDFRDTQSAESQT